MLAWTLMAIVASQPQPTAQPTAWTPAPVALRTRWAAEINPASPWPEYPRPTRVRERWQNLNGLWSHAVARGGGAVPESAAWSPILVPFPVESSLSGVGGRVGPEDTLWYRRTFTVPADWKSDGQRVLLHFGAVDWHAKVSVNGRIVGEHKGGYDPFTFDITDALVAGFNTVVVEVRDPTDAGGQPRGKQWSKPHGIWYTPSTGIWQTVWLEPVPATHIGRVMLRGEPGAEGTADLRSDIEIVGNAEGLSFELTLLEGSDAKASVSIDGLTASAGLRLAPALRVAGITPWSPDTPKLYPVRLTLRRGDKVVDRVDSYVGFRDIRVAKDGAGVPRLMLNGKPVFQFGPLDQGFWPDGLYTPPNEAAMKFDIQAVKDMGGNMLRKHVKVESERFYHLCDTMGVMVWQDVPSPFFHDGKGENPHGNPPLTGEWKANFENEAREIVQDFGNHPSIVMWVPWNEGWGQNDLAWSKDLVDRVKQWDPSRLVNCASGWTDTGNGDVLDIHVYPGPASPPVQESRAAVLGEYGGLGLPIEGHTWLSKNNWGYVSYPSKETLTNAYVKQLEEMPALIAEGLTAAVYTQTTDVEIEVNGLLTYDRAVWKIDPSRAKAAAAGLYLPPPKTQVLVPRAGQSGDQTWRWTTTSPGKDWMLAGYNDSAWRSGAGGFGTRQTPGARVGTEWNSGEIWLRRKVIVAKGAARPMLSVHHDEDAQIFINGELAASLSGYTTSYRMIEMSEKAAELVRAGGELQIAVHCKQTMGGQYIDVGIVDLSLP